MSSNMIVALDLSAFEEKTAESWNELRGYIATSEYDDVTGRGTWTDGIDYVVLDDGAIAYRLSGDWRDDSNWQIGTVEDFLDFVKSDFEEVTERMSDDDSN